ncbi:MAG: hypothetical protein IJX50_00975 [Clostridia bacterium]|nr:hypothetical protein [Clostridia bacterium]
MKKNKIIATVVAAILVIGGISVFAEQSAESKKTTPKTKIEFMQEQKEAFVDKCKENLATKLAEGKITQAEYDEQLQRIESGELPALKGRGFGKGKHFQKKEMTEEEKAQMKAKMQEKAKERLEKQLSEGKITQEKYDEQLSKIESGELSVSKGRSFGKRKHFQKKEVTEE